MAFSTLNLEANYIIFRGKFWSKPDIYMHFPVASCFRLFASVHFFPVNNDLHKTVVCRFAITTVILTAASGYFYRSILYR